MEYHITLVCPPQVLEYMHTREELEGPFDWETSLRLPTTHEYS
jgi:hypothetical protein